MKLFLKYQWIILIGLIISGCSITKRVYQPGYHIEWRTKKAMVNHDLRSEKSENVSSEKNELSVIASEDNFVIQKSKSTNRINSLASNQKNNVTTSQFNFPVHKTLEKKIVPKKIKQIIHSSYKGVNLQEPSGQLFLLGILSLIFIGLGVTLLYFTTPPQINIGYVCLMIGTICLIAFFRTLAILFAGWAFG